MPPAEQRERMRSMRGRARIQRLSLGRAHAARRRARCASASASRRGCSATACSDTRAGGWRSVDGASRPGCRAQGGGLPQYRHQLGIAVEEVHRLRRRIVAADADRQPGRSGPAKHRFIVDVVTDEECRAGRRSLDQAGQGIGLVGRAGGDDVDDELAAEACQGRLDAFQNVLDAARAAAASGA